MKVRVIDKLELLHHTIDEDGVHIYFNIVESHEEEVTETDSRDQDATQTEDTVSHPHASPLLRFPPYPNRYRQRDP